MITIIDAGIGNLFNVKRAFSKLEVETRISQSVSDIDNASKLVLPGVGAFGEGMKNLEINKLIKPIQKAAVSGKPILGICLGMQMLLTESEELGLWKGLDLIPGRVTRFQSPQDESDSFKIPQIGWNSIERNEKHPGPDSWSQTPLEDLGAKPYMYFVHSYMAQPDNQNDVLGFTKYGHDRFCSVVYRDNVVGCQFHPERSGSLGLRILQNFLKLN